LLRWRCGSGDLGRMPRDCSHLRRSRTRSRSSAVIGRSGRHRRSELSTGNRGSASGRRRWWRDMTGPRRVLRWRRGSDDPERQPIAIRDETDDPGSQCACRRNPKRKTSARRMRCGLHVCIRADCTRMRKLGLSEHSNTLRIVSSDPSTHSVHVPSPCVALIEMSRGTVLRVRPPGFATAKRAADQVFYPKPSSYENARLLRGRSGRVDGIVVRRAFP
jgi:hypothetical protein